MDRFFQDPSPLFGPTFHAMWVPKWEDRHRLILSLLGVEVSFDWFDVKWDSEGHFRVQAIKNYLSSWSQSTVTFQGSGIIFDSLRGVEVLNDYTTALLLASDNIGDDPTKSYAILVENMALALALAWQIHRGTKDFSIWTCGI